MTSEREPTLYQIRAELESSTQTHQGESFLVVKDPVTDRYFRFPETQAAILDLLRDPCDLDTLTRRAADRLGTKIPSSTLGRFLDSLDSKLLLENAESRSRIARLAGRKPGERNWLYIRLMSLDASRLFDWLAPKVSWCFTPAFHIFALASILTGIVITTIHAESLLRDVLSLFNLYGIVLIWFVVVAVGVLHELAHGLTCRHFGGKVKELGFMLIYFQPAFYCDVSDSWMFPSRRERMWVTFAGGYFQLALWGMAAVAWRIFYEGTVVNWIATSVLVFSGLQTLINFNPLIKLDGYYMLSDYLEIPNLRSKALQATRSWIAGHTDPLLASGQRGALLTFGVLSLTFSTLLLAVIYVNIYMLATSYLAFAGVAVFVLFAGFTLRRTGAETAAAAGALVKRASYRKYLYLGVAGTLILLTFIVPWTLRIPAEFAVRPAEEFQVRAPIDGMVDEVMVREGEKAHHGQEVLYIYNSDLEERRTELQGLYDSQYAEFQQMEAGPRAEDLRPFQETVRVREQELANVNSRAQQRMSLVSELDALEAAVRQAEDRATALVNLADEELGPRLDADAALEQVNIAKGQRDAKLAQITSFDDSLVADRELAQRHLAEAESQLELARAGAREDERQRALDASMNLMARLMQVNDELYLGSVKTLITGTVVTPDLELLEGDTVTKGELLMTIQSLGVVLVEMRVAERDIADVQIGSPVTLVVNAYSDRKFEGQVSRIAEVSQEDSDGKRFTRVTVELPNEDRALSAGMTGHAKIDAGEHKIAYLMTRRLIKWIRTDLWHFLPI